MKILVTGASGFIGKAIVAEISHSEFEVYELLNLNPVSESSKSAAAKNIFRADVSDYESLFNAVKIQNIDVVIHSAGLAHQFDGQTKENFWRINVYGAENAARLAISLKAKHFILISSVSVYGVQKYRNQDAPNSAKYCAIGENAECRPQGFYAQSKLEAEKVVGRICTENEIALTILRLATVIGEADKGNVARLINSIDKRRFMWIGGGENFKSLIYKEDVAKACRLVLDKTNKTEIFNVTGEAVKMKRVVSEISLNLGRKIPDIRIPAKFLYQIFSLNGKFFKIRTLNDFAETVDKWLADDVFSGEKFERVYGFRAATPIGEAIKRQVENYKKLKS